MRQIFLVKVRSLANPSKWSQPPPSVQTHYHTITRRTVGICAMIHKLQKLKSKCFLFHSLFLHIFIPLYFIILSLLCLENVPNTTITFCVIDITCLIPNLKVMMLI